MAECIYSSQARSLYMYMQLYLHVLSPIFVGSKYNNHVQYVGGEQSEPPACITIHVELFMKGWIHKSYLHIFTMIHFYYFQYTLYSFL